MNSEAIRVYDTNERTQLFTLQIGELSITKIFLAQNLLFLQYSYQVSLPQSFGEFMSVLDVSTGGMLPLPPLSEYIDGIPPCTT